MSLWEMEVVRTEPSALVAVRRDTGGPLVAREAAASRGAWAALVADIDDAGEGQGLPTPLFVGLAVDHRESPGRQRQDRVDAAPNSPPRNGGATEKRDTSRGVVGSDTSRMTMPAPPYAR